MRESIIERVFQVLAVALVGLSAWFWSEGNTDGLFLAAVGGAVCFFLSIRFQVKGRLREREPARQDADHNEP